MKKTFLVRRNTLLSSANVSWGMLVLACALAVFLLRFSAPNLFWQVCAPLFRASDALATETHTLIAGFGTTAALSIRNEQLVSENTALASENQALLQKMNALGALLGSSAASLQNTSGILAGVVARPPESPYDTLVLSAGKSAGVTRGMEAYGPGDVPLGVVETVFDNFSRVTLFSAPGITTYGWIGPSAIPLTIRGAGAGALNASLARSAGIVVGDTVFAPGPGMLPIGSVARIDSDPSSPAVTLRIVPVLNPFSITWVRLRAVGTVLFSPLPAATSTFP